MYRIEFVKKAAKFYQKSNNAIARRLNIVFERLSENPFNLPNLKHLKGELAGSYRIRIGDIRVIYSVDDANKIVYIEVIGFRGDVYK